MKEIIIICQAPADIQYALDIYEKNKTDNNVSIFVINVKGMYDFLISLDLLVENIKYIPHVKKFKLRNPWSILSLKMYLRSIYNNLFKKYKNTTVYYFSKYEDIVTAYLIEKLKKSNKVFYVDHYDSIASNEMKTINWSVKNTLEKCIYQMITNARYRIMVVNDIRYLEYINDQNIEAKLKPDKDITYIYEKYKYNFNSTNIPSTILLLSDPELSNIFDNDKYREYVQELIQFLKKTKLKIYLKPHPRIKCPEYIVSKVDGIIPGFVPAEFLDTRNVKLIIGEISTALSHFARNTSITTISLLNVIPLKNHENLKHFSNYLIKLSDNKIIFAENLNSLKSIIADVVN